jgi:hypothetical protein
MRAERVIGHDSNACRASKEIQMTRIAGLQRGLLLAALALLMSLAAPTRQANAVSLITPSASPSAKQTTGEFTEIRFGGHGGGHWHGGGGWHHGGWHGGWRHGWGGGWHHGWRGGWHGGWHRRFYGGYSPYYYGGYYPACRIVWTYWGPRRVCGYHHWGWRHRWHRYYW